MSSLAFTAHPSRRAFHWIWQFAASICSYMAKQCLVAESIYDNPQAGSPEGQPERLDGANKLKNLVNLVSCPV